MENRLNSARKRGKIREIRTFHHMPRLFAIYSNTRLENIV